MLPDLLDINIIFACLYGPNQARAVLSARQQKYFELSGRECQAHQHLTNLHVAEVSCGGDAIQQQVNRHWASTSYKQLNRSSYVPNLSISGKSYGRDQTNIDAS